MVLIPVTFRVLFMCDNGSCKNRYLYNTNIGVLYFFMAICVANHGGRTDFSYVTFMM